MGEMNDIPPNQQTATIGFEAITGMPGGMPRKGERTDAWENFIIRKRADPLPILIEHLARKQKISASALARPAEIAVVLPERNLMLVDH